MSLDRAAERHLPESERRGSFPAAATAHADLIAAIGDWIAKAKPKDALEMAVHGERYRTEECSGNWDERTEGGIRLDRLADQASGLSIQARALGLASLSLALVAYENSFRIWQMRKLDDAIASWSRLDCRLHLELDQATPRSLAAAGRDGDRPAPGYADHHHDLPPSEEITL